MNGSHQHDWKPGASGLLWHCRDCGATAMRVPLTAAGPSPHRKWAFLGGSAGLLGLLYMLFG